MSQKILFLMITTTLFLGWLAGPGLSAEGKSTVILYGSRYGATEQTARWIAEGMGQEADVQAVKEAGDLSGVHFIILGSGIYYDQLQEDMTAFLAARKDEIKDKVVALFVVSGSGPGGGAYLETFAQALGRKPGLTKAFSGWMKKERLSAEDYKALEGYYKNANQPFENYDRTDKEACLQFGREILKAIK
jgi:menaquinone-dependent protoporphyrinogen IX oxidase